jgi:hypothetical protein
MNAGHKELLEKEIALARELMDRGDYDDAFLHLQRTHVLGQAHVRWHVVSHWLMLIAPELSRAMEDRAR